MSLKVEMDRLFDPFNGIDFIYCHGLIFIDQEHLNAYELFTPGKLRDDKEWSSSVYILTADFELRKKVSRHIRPVNRSIYWDGILSTDFGSGHYAAIYWAFGLWSGSSWGGWEDDDGKKIHKVDITSKAYSMGPCLQFVVLVAQAYRWGLSGKIPVLSKMFIVK
jgi:hypothetical protein